MKNIYIIIASVLCFNSAFTQDTTDTGARFNQYGKRVDRLALNAEARNGILVFESKDQVGNTQDQYLQTPEGIKSKIVSCNATP